MHLSMAKCRQKKIGMKSIKYIKIFQKFVCLAVFGVDNIISNVLPNVMFLILMFMKKYPGQCLENICILINWKIGTFKKHSEIMFSK